MASVNCDSVVHASATLMSRDTCDLYAQRSTALRSYSISNLAVKTHRYIVMTQVELQHVLTFCMLLNMHQHSNAHTEA
jgi:hypothetical protein